MDLLKIEGLSHRFENGAIGLKHIELSVREGELVVVAGANGSGKTTLLLHMNALILPQTGSVTVAGISAARDPIKVRQLAGMVFQNPDSQIVGETVSDDVAFGPENLRLPRHEIESRVSAALSAVGISHLSAKSPHLLSGGEKRRLTIAGVLAMHPRVILFDEPFSGLDYFGARDVLQQIVSLHQSGRTLVVVTHDIEKIIAHADRLLVMQNGAIERQGAPALMLPDLRSVGVKEPCFCQFGLEMTSWLS